VSRWEYTKGLHDLGNGAFAYLQPNGSWGWSNAGLITAGRRSLLVDTLFDLCLTRDMLAAMKPLTDTSPIETLVNTHANGDHCWGNQLVGGAEIVASAACREEMAALDPAMLAALVAADGMGRVGDYLKACFESFAFDEVRLTLPTRVFEGRLTLRLGDKPIELIEVGPAHTRGDVLVHVPEDRTVFTGDILFIDGTPIVWEGPLSNWIAACDLMLELDLETVVPGHGPIAGKDGIARVREYLGYVEAEARKRYEAGMSAEDAARDIALGDFSGWGERERIAVNVDTVYRHLGGETAPPDVVRLFGLMAELA
jgi:cyclase